MDMTNQEKIDRLMAAIVKYNEVTRGDADLVAGPAAEHSVDVVRSEIGDPLSFGNYNYVTFTDLENAVEKVMDAEVIEDVCEDRRVSAQSMQARYHGGYNPQTPRGTKIAVPEKTITITSAGGPAQKKQERFDANVGLFLSMYEVNPGLKFRFSAHGGVCGGVKAQTGGENEKILKEQGSEAEQAYMAQPVVDLVTALHRGGVPMENMEAVYSIVDEHDVYQGDVPIQLQ